MADDFQTGKESRAELVVPPNQLKEKVGTGGFEEKVVAKAEEQIKNNTVDFQPIAAEFISQLDKAIADAQSGALKGAVAVEALLAPTMQLKAQGALFHYPLVSEISNILVNFLETVVAIDKDVLEILAAHRTSISAVLSERISEKDKEKSGRELCRALAGSCDRYARARKK